MNKLLFLLVWLAVVFVITACTGEVDDIPASVSPQIHEPTLAPTPIATLPTATQFPDFPSTATVAPTSTPDTDVSYSRRTPFVPLDNPALLSKEDATYLNDDELVLGMEWGNEARAYPVRMLKFHHIVNDNIGGRSFLITY